MRFELPSTRSSVKVALEIAYILVISVVLVLLCVRRSHQHDLWPDEVLSLTIFRAGSWQHMMHGWFGGVDGGGIAYYLFGRPWMLLFGFTPLSMRLFSTAAVILSIVLLWIAVRRFYSTLSIIISITVVYLSSVTILWQNINGRFYGLFLAAAAFNVWIFIRLTTAQQTSRRDYFLFAIAQSLLIGSHVLGLIYSFAFIAGLFLFDIYHRHLRPRLYLCGVAGWSVLVLSLPAMMRTTSVAQKVFWTVKPRSRDLLLAVFAYSNVAKRFASLLILCASITWLLHRFFWRREPSHIDVCLDREPLRFLIAIFWLAELIIFAKSQVGISIFADRYLLPVALATVLLLAELLEASVSHLPVFLRGIASPVPTILLATASFAIFARHALVTDVYGPIYPRAGYTQRIMATLPKDEVVVVTPPQIYELLALEDPTHHYIFMNDRSFDLRPGTPVRDLAGFRLLDNWKAAGFYSNEILSCSQALADYPRFTLVVADSQQDWLNDRILQNVNLSKTKIASVDDFITFTVWRIERVGHIPSCV